MESWRSDSMNVDFLIMRNKIRLEQMINENEDYEKILKQSQKLDKYINIKMKEIEKQSPLRQI